MIKLLQITYPIQPAVECKYRILPNKKSCQNFNNMKKVILIIVALCASLMTNAQPKSIYYEKEYDFFVNVITNPTSRLYDLLWAGMNSKNTLLKDKSIYVNNQEAKEMCAKLNISVSVAYDKIYASWLVFLEIENTDISINGFGKYMINYHRDNLDRPRTCPNPELKHKLSIVPLKLEVY